MHALRPRIVGIKYVLGMVGIVLLVSGFASASTYTINGGSHYQAGANPAVWYTQGNNGPACWQLNDVIIFNNQESTDNRAGAAAVTVVYTMELFQWLQGGGGRGASLNGPFTTTHIVGKGNTLITNTLSVTGVYNGWNGVPACVLSFEVYRTTSVNGGAATTSSAYY